VAVLPLPGLGRSWLLPLAVTLIGLAWGRPGKTWQSGNIIFQGKTIPGGDAFLALSPSWGSVAAHRTPALTECEHPSPGPQLLVRCGAGSSSEPPGCVREPGLQGRSRSGCPYPLPAKCLPWARLPPSPRSPRLGWSRRISTAAKKQEQK